MPWSESGTRCDEEWLRDQRDAKQQYSIKLKYSYLNPFDLREKSRRKNQKNEKTREKGTGHRNKEKVESVQAQQYVKRKSPIFNNTCIWPKRVGSIKKRQALSYTQESGVKNNQVVEDVAEISSCPKGRTYGVVIMVMNPRGGIEKEKEKREGEKERNELLIIWFIP